MDPRPNRILVVDDNPDTQTVIAMLLRSSGSDVLVASNGLEAMRVMGSGSDIGLVLADIVMPGLSGFDLAKRIKAANPQMPVLLMTGYAGYVDAIEQIGGVPLLKPFGGELLRRVVDENLGRPVVAS